MRAQIHKIVSDMLLTNESFSSGEIAKVAGISRQAVHRHLKAMLSSGELVREGAGRGARYRSRRRAFVAHLLRADGLDEGRVWDRARVAMPRLAEFKNAGDVLAHAFTEMLNNAIDHSSSPTIDVEVEMDVAGDAAGFTVSDRGIGVFENVRAKLGLESLLAALQEISKGKISTDPARHSGEGIFFTSKMARTFEIEANGLLWVVDNARHDHMIAEKIPRPGTVVRFETPLAAAPEVAAVYAPYAHDFEFDTSRVVVKLFEHGVRFVSRSEAKRLLVGLDKFRTILLDFAGVEGVGQGFADEVFRVWARQHPETRLVAEGMTVPVTFMVERARRAATGAG
jgi:anti-sigma regulatory factor (Ser/Thr protein kinase)/biotin operon repressor